MSRGPATFDGVAVLAARLGAALPPGPSQSTSADRMIEQRLRSGWRPERALDVGRGDSATIERLALMAPAAAWRGIDAVSPGGSRPERWRDGRILPYDGHEIPFPDRRFGLVRAVDVLSATPRPDLLLREMARVLADDGLLVGEVSQFEPSHHGVRRNLTPAGLLEMAADAGLCLEEVGHGEDGFAALQAAYARGGGTAVPARAVGADVCYGEDDGRAGNLAALLCAGRWAFALRRGPVQALPADPGGSAAAPADDPAAFPGSLAYWRWRYAAGRDSGAGSYGRFAEFKAEVLNATFKELGIGSAIEFGCGDGNQLALLEVPTYLGLDVSPLAIERCRSAFRDQPGRRFAPLEAYAGEQADCALSLDVIYHLVEDAVYEDYMRRLFGAARRCVVIYSSDEDAMDGGAPHVRHRRFSAWVARHADGEWMLLRHVPNRYPFRGDAGEGSFADFFIYIRRADNPGA